MIRVLSLGAGVQSTTLALMASHGEFPDRVDAAIFADTQWEPAAVYAHLAWLTPRLAFPVHVVTVGSLRANQLTKQKTERRISRRDCETWLTDHGYGVPPKSACIGCPFHNQATWIEMRDQRPAEFADACALDAALRAGPSVRGIRAQEYMHPARLPLAEAVAATQPDANQYLFDFECEGMCGL